MFPSTCQSKADVCWKCSNLVFCLPIFGIADKVIKKPEKTDVSSFKKERKEVTVSTINFGIKMTAAKTKEVILKLRRRLKNTLGAPESSRVGRPGSPANRLAPPGSP